MKKRIFSTLLSLCMVLTLLPTTAFATPDYGIWVGTIEVTSENASNVLGDSGTPTVTYDTDTNTLTLNNANIISATQSGSNPMTCGIFREDGDLNIVLHGTNTIGFSANSDLATAGIYAGGKLSIKGTSTDSLSVTNTFTTKWEAVGIRGNTGVTIDGCTVTATAGSSTDGQNTFGINAGNGNLSIKNAIVTGTGGSTTWESFGMSVDNSGSVIIENSTVTANGGEGTVGSYGIISSMAATISNSTVTATGNTHALLFFQTPTITGINATASTDKTGAGAAPVTLDASVYGMSSTYKYVKIAPNQAQWGVAGSNNTIPASWVGSGSLTQAVEYANGLSSETAYIQLLANVDNSEAHEINNNKSAILDLNGKTITAKPMVGSDKDHNILLVYGELTLCDSSDTDVTKQGKITGGHGTGDGMGGGVYVDDSGIFIMTGGNITGNTAEVGGGVANTGIFTMTGGSIADNSCVGGSESKPIGGGVANLGSFTITGGSITGNTVASGGTGGGVANAVSMTLSGNVNISGNTQQSAASNVSLFYGEHLGVATQPKINIDGALANETPIGVSIVEVTVDDGTFIFTPKAGVFTSGDTVKNSDYADKFVSENDSYGVMEADDNQLKLAQAYTISGTIKGSDTSAGISASLQLKNSAGNNVGSAVTAAADGSFSFTDIPAGSYTIAVSCTGYDSGTITEVTVSNAAITGVDLTLTKSISGLTDAQKLAEAQAAIMAAINRMSFSNSTTAADILSVAQAASLYGVTMAWDTENEFTKTQATSSAKGSIRGTLLLTLNEESGGIAIDAAIAKLSTGGSSTPSPSTKPTEPITGKTEIIAPVDNNGNVNVNLTDKNIADAIADAKAEAAKKGVNAGDITVVIHVTTGDINANTVTVNLPKTIQEQVIGNRIASVQLVIDRPDLTVGISLAAVIEINKQANADVQLSATRIDNTKLSGDAKKAIGNRPVFDLKATYGNGKFVTDFGNGIVSIAIPYTLGANEKAENVRAVYVDNTGKVHEMTNSVYDSAHQVIRFETSHFSVFGIAYYNEPSASESATDSGTETNPHTGFASFPIAMMLVCLVVAILVSPKMRRSSKTHKTR